jgi:hypothetical protein
LVAFRSFHSVRASRRPARASLVQAERPCHHRGGIVEELDAEVAGAPRHQAREVFGGGLGHGVEQRVAAADVGLQGVLHADAILQPHVVPVAGAAAVGLVGPRREERAEDAVLHVEHRDLLVDDHLEPPRGHRPQQVVELLGAEVVRRRHPDRPAGLQQLDGQLVGGVQREVGHERHAPPGAEEQSPGVAYEQAVGPLLGQVPEQVRLARLLNARGGEEDACVRRGPPHRRDGLLVELDVLIFEVDRADARRDRRLGLRRRPAEGGQLRVGACRPSGPLSPGRGLG